MLHLIIVLLYFFVGICLLEAKYFIALNSNTNMNGNFGAKVNSVSNLNINDKITGQNIQSYNNVNVDSDSNTNLGLNSFSNMNYANGADLSSGYLAADSGLNLNNKDSAKVNANSGLEVTKIQSNKCKCLDNQLSDYCKEYCLALFAV